MFSGIGKDGFPAALLILLEKPKEEADAEACDNEVGSLIQLKEWRRTVKRGSKFSDIVKKRVRAKAFYIFENFNNQKLWSYLCKDIPDFKY